MKLRAERPQYCALSNAKLQSLGIVMPPWQDAIARYVAEL
jgi:dTDP-4-dehydrorhamnose reductase